ncbi:MAG TPA: DUF5317 family protein [Candidatus Limnocylindrales bacterium]|nr:DUF5317 family protein [Candidatus Limnocylindrales bacterium]
MFILYSVAIGLIAGVLLRGSPGRLGELRFRWAPLIVIGTLIQLALFSDPVTARIGSLGPGIYVASTGLVLLAVVRNFRIAGIAIVAVGAASNLAAIVANGGYMPASAAALAGHGGGNGYSNSVVLANPALAPLTDLFALPAWVPAANVFSVGDVLIAVGIVVAIVVRMRTEPVVDVRDRLVRFEPQVAGHAADR